MSGNTMNCIWIQEQWNPTTKSDQKCDTSQRHDHPPNESDVQYQAKMALPAFVNKRVATYGMSDAPYTNGATE